MQFVIQQSFTAQPFIGTSGIPLNVAPKDFVQGQSVDATQQIAAYNGQTFWVSSDGYPLDMTKVSSALNPNVAVIPAPLQAGPVMNLQVAQGFTASPFVFDPSAPPLSLQPKIFVTGQHIDAQQQYNSLQQPFMVSGGYIVDMSKVQQINYPQYYQPQYQPPMGYYGPAPRVRYRQAEVEMGNDQRNPVQAVTALPATGLSGLLTKNNIIFAIIAILLIYVFIKKSS